MSIKLGHDVRLLLAAQTASAIGTGTSILVLPLLALSIRDSAVDAGMVGLVNGATAMLCVCPVVAPRTGSTAGRSWWHRTRSWQ